MIATVPRRQADSTSPGPGHATAGARVLSLTVLNAPVLVELGHGIAGIRWEDPSYRLPGVHTIPGPADAIRVRSEIAHAGTAADPWPQYAVDAY